jgi:hypothetical protein
MAATKLMLVAEGMNLASCPMIGFDSASVASASAFGLSATEAPVMLVTVGRAMEDNWPRKPHKPVSRVTGFGLTHLVIRHTFLVLLMSEVDYDASPQLAERLVRFRKTRYTTSTGALHSSLRTERDIRLMANQLPRILLIGCGNMGGAMLSGWLDRGVEKAVVVAPRPHQDNRVLVCRDMTEIPDVSPKNGLQTVFFP